MYIMILCNKSFMEENFQNILQTAKNHNSYIIVSNIAINSHINKLPNALKHMHEHVKRASYIYLIW